MTLHYNVGLSSKDSEQPGKQNYELSRFWTTPNSFDRSRWQKSLS